VVNLLQIQLRSIGNTELEQFLRHVWINYLFAAYSTSKCLSW
jgi:hypothetical protein